MVEWFPSQKYTQTFKSRVLHTLSEMLTELLILLKAPSSTEQGIPGGRGVLSPFIPDNLHPPKIMCNKMIMLLKKQKMVGY